MLNQRITPKDRLVLRQQKNDSQQLYERFSLKFEQFSLKIFISSFYEDRQTDSMLNQRITPKDRLVLRQQKNVSQQLYEWFSLKFEWFSLKIFISSFYEDRQTDSMLNQRITPKDRLVLRQQKNVSRLLYEWFSLKFERFSLKFFISSFYEDRQTDSMLNQRITPKDRLVLRQQKNVSQQLYEWFSLKFEWFSLKIFISSFYEDRQTDSMLNQRITPKDRLVLRQQKNVSRLLYEWFSLKFERFSLKFFISSFYEDRQTDSMLNQRITPKDRLVLRQQKNDSQQLYERFSLKFEQFSLKIFISSFYEDRQTDSMLNQRITPKDRLVLRQQKNVSRLLYEWFSLKFEWFSLKFFISSFYEDRQTDSMLNQRITPKDKLVLRQQKNVSQQLYEWFSLKFERFSLKFFISSFYEDRQTDSMLNQRITPKDRLVLRQQKNVSRLLYVWFSLKFERFSLKFEWFS